MTKDEELFSAVNTVRASCITVFMAKLFGRKIETWDEYGVRLRAYHYKGKTYLTSFNDDSERLGK